MADDCERLSGPGEEHALLEPFVGTFRAEVRMWMGPGDPMVSTGTMKNTMIFGDTFLEQVYDGDESSTGPFPDFKGRGYWGFNRHMNRWEGVWIDTASTMIQTDTGTRDGDTWTMLGEVPSMQKKSVIRLVDPDHHVMEMYFVDPEGNEFKGMEIAYARA
ncbi:MAG: DUF1579 family protein [Phycisphaerales bacterium]|nr:DUF1579 family protein [Phycisphaerales bacterium]